LANQKGYDLSEITGSGPNGRIIKQDIDSYTPTQKVATHIEEKII
jgi:pyruvate dehydrogenase E2 component (dihydrolipoamide acetyltransferase)